MESIKKVLINLQCELVAERNVHNPQNITWIQYDILNVLQNNDEILPGELSKRLGISRSKLSKAMKELKIQGLISQEPSNNDGRELLTRISDKGFEVMKFISEGHDDIYKSALAVFSEEEMDIYAELSQKLISEISKRRVLKNEK